ncbi:MAG: AAA family ATPase [Alphaproteobacteria bacterium]|nr:AAA family ATPase [Alphaproteobacteria bacterium]
MFQNLPRLDVKRDMWINGWAVPVSIKEKIVALVEGVRSNPSVIPVADYRDLPKFCLDVRVEIGDDILRYQAKESLIALFDFVRPYNLVPSSHAPVVPLKMGFVPGLTQIALSKPTRPNFKPLEEVLFEIGQEFVGLDNVKELFRRIATTHVEYLGRLAHGERDLQKPSHHMILAGNPGTGKTTIARYVGKLLHAAGYLSKPDVHEVTRKDMVGEYIGHTALITNKAVNEAMGGVLFIDEAGSFAYSDSDRDFGAEAIKTLIARLENDRHGFVCVMASYPDEIEKLLKIDDGLSSRIAHQVKIKDFSADEMIDIFYNKLLDYQLVIDDEKVMTSVERLITQVVRQGNAREYGNGRFIRNMLETLVSVRASHDINLSFDDVFDRAAKHGVNKTLTLEVFEKARPLILEKAKIGSDQYTRRPAGFTAKWD